MFKNRMEARLYALREIVAYDERIIPLLRDMKKEHPRAFAWLMDRLDGKVSEVREERLAEVPPALAELPEGELDMEDMTNAQEAASIT